ncbi:Os08g0389800 [Oryza sativa Japonica Group]|uniref:Os08g0389800 protein n=1 Tax=Oryza sativa subsp. japonica TaxID=39947 RepID=Q0J5Y1_ORYSJ|nr:Os08g0389800 [Oryza sativa Japonica Group]|eukprot:NP_001061720.2 Os08g0389800 [Oryza sativa Japonica Group]
MAGRGVQQKSTGVAGLLVPSSHLVQPLPAVAHDMAGQSSHEHDVIVGDRGADGKQRTQISEFMTMEEDVAGAIDANANGDDNTLCRIVPEEMADKAPNQFSICQKGIWTVQKVVLEHNHCLVSPNKSHKLRSQRRVIEADRQLIGQIREAGMKPAQVYEFMKEWYGGADKVPFSKMDCNNEIGRECKKCVYEERSEYHFNKMWHELWSEYKLEDNVWMSNLYRLKKKWAIVFRDSFTADMTSTQRSEGMNNVFKKRFRRKLGLSELLVECDKVAASLRENELDADFKSRNSSPVTCIPNLPMLKTAADSYTRKMYSEFEEEFTKQFSLSWSILTFMVMPMESDQEATVVYNTADMTITCSCRKYESIGGQNMQKKGFNIDKQGSEKETLKTHAARISQKATSIALKCSVSKELLDDLEKAINNLDLEADSSLSKMQEKTCEVPLNSNDCVMDTLNGAISIRVPRVVKGPKSRRSKDAVEKKKRKKTKTAKNKGEDLNNASEDEDEDVGDVCGQSLTMAANDVCGQSSTMAAYDVYGQSSTMAAYDGFGQSSTMDAPLIQGGFTSLLFGVQQDSAMAARKLHFN